MACLEESIEELNRNMVLMEREDEEMTQGTKAKKKKDRINI